MDLHSRPARILPVETESWPTTKSQPNAVTIEFDAGYYPAGAIKSFSISDPGTGYAADDVLTIVQAGGEAGTLTVTEVDGAGVIVSAELATAGSGYAIAAALATTALPEGGTGCEVDVTALESTAPERFKVAIRWLVAHWYEERTPVTEKAKIVLPNGFDRLIWALRITSLA